MKLEDQVCSVEQSEQLKELGIVQESLFYHTYSKFGILPKRSCDFKEGDPPSAFTVAELGVMLQQYIHSIYYDHEIHKWNRKDFDKQVKEDVYAWIVHDTQAQAYADYLIYRIKKGWITIEELNERLLKS